jgi:probable rRNA maturation factor
MSGGGRRRAPAIIVEISREAGVRAPSAAEVRRVALVALRSGKRRLASVSIALVTNATIARLNRRFLAHRGPTDVISFTLAGPSGDAGDIYIAPAVAREAAAALGIPVREEILRLVVHGILHVTGHDHPDGEARLRSPMWRKQEAILRRALRVRRPATVQRSRS